MKLTKPFELFAQAATGTAPFVLPRIPFKVNQYWTFQQGAGDVPTFPVAALQLYGWEEFGDLVQLVKKVAPSYMERLPGDVEKERITRGLVGMIRDLRDLFEGDPLLGGKVREELERSGLRAKDEDRYRRLKALITIYGGEASRYINFYGPPGTIPTIPYHQALQIGTESGPAFDVVKGKAVFVGLSEVLLAERKDSFYTVFSQGNGVFIGGVEIAASAFLNLLDDATIVPISLPAHIGLSLSWGGVSSGCSVGCFPSAWPPGRWAVWPGCIWLSPHTNFRPTSNGIRFCSPSSCSCRSGSAARSSGTMSNRNVNARTSATRSVSIYRTMSSINWRRTWRTSRARRRWSTEPACLPMRETIPRSRRK
ncbi:MAG: hypothetical protein CV089_23285 [Nitrospira sp. WS110]|nr:hypothetical protein [Nitrospira sp. WS110]